jgi:predicted Zn-dependent peptidase
MVSERSVERTVLPNGLTILSERMEHVRSVAMGVWVRAGSRHEVAELNGISHFVEHMVFKGTETRTAQRIAREVDAFTGKETICFNIKVLDEHVPVALDVVSDLVLHPIFAEGDIQRERGVIFEEIKMDEDNPDYLVHEIFTQNFWRGHPLGKPILGTKETVGRLEQAKLFNYYGDRFRAGNIVFTAAGNLDHQRFVDEVRRRFEAMPPGMPQDVSLPPTTSAKIATKRRSSKCSFVWASPPSPSPATVATSPCS